jgi:hypothetical protein
MRDAFVRDVAETNTKIPALKDGSRGKQFVFKVMSGAVVRLGDFRAK